MAGMGYSYFNRTIAGYFDTDLSSVFLPALALYCLLAAHRRLGGFSGGLDWKQRLLRIEQAEFIG